MLKIYLTFIGLLLFHLISAQSIHGIVCDKRKIPVTGASVIVAGTFDATITDSLGRFYISGFATKDTFVLKISAIGLEDAVIKIPGLQSQQDIIIILSEKLVQLKEVVISAGSFEASDEKKTSILKPFDLATVPASPPDVFKAINELPGTSKVGESEGLFVRGGAASETKAVIDGLIVQDPFFSSVPGIAQNGRFSALLFKGTSFSTGGYSPQFWEALFSLLLLNTQDWGQAPSSSVIFHNTSISGNNTQKNGKNLLTVNAKKL